jgi:predicted enzyme related to lactoylglutathione lyase
MSDPVVHFELPADDLERAQRFYREAFGWAMNAMPQMGYVLASTTETDERGRPREVGAINGGMLRRQAPITAPIVTVQVASIDEAGRRVEELGGEMLIGRQPVADMGFSAYVRDTEGNVIGLWENAS